MFSYPLLFPHPLRHFSPTPPSFEVGPLRQGLPYMGTAPNGSHSLAASVTRASVNKGAEGKRRATAGGKERGRGRLSSLVRMCATSTHEAGGGARA